MISEGKYVDAIRQLPEIDKFEAVDAVVARLIALQPPNIDRIEIRARVWRDLLWHEDLRHPPDKGERVMHAALQTTEMSAFDEFIARCQALARDVREGRMGFIDAVDAVQSAAEASGIVVDIGPQDKFSRLSQKRSPPSMMTLRCVPKRPCCARPICWKPRGSKVKSGGLRRQQFLARLPRGR